MGENTFSLLFISAFQRQRGKLCLQFRVIYLFILNVEINCCFCTCTPQPHTGSYFFFYFYTCADTIALCSFGKTCRLFCPVLFFLCWRNALYFIIWVWFYVKLLNFDIFLPRQILVWCFYFGSLLWVLHLTSYCCISIGRITEM